MSTPASPVVAQVPAAPAPAPKKPLTAIQVVEQELIQFAQQEIQVVSQLHAVKGAIQAGNILLQKLKAEEQKAVAYFAAETVKAEAEAKKLAGEVVPVVEHAVAEMETEAKTVATDVEAEAKKVGAAVENAL